MLWVYVMTCYQRTNERFLSVEVWFSALVVRIQMNRWRLIIETDIKMDSTRETGAFMNNIHLNLKF